MRKFVAPPLPEPFPEPFVRLLHELLARGASPRAQRDDRRRARRAMLAQTGTFVGHRRYARGDDPRRIDWSALARSGELFVKQHADDDRRTVTLLLDLAPRMAVGEPMRRLAALRVAAVLGGLALRRVDGVQILAPGAGTSSVATFGGAGELTALLAHLCALPIALATPRETLALCEPRLATGAVHWVSDFADAEAAALIVRALRRRGVPVHGWLPSLPIDTQLAVGGYVELADPDSGRSLMVAVDGALLAAVREELAQLRLRQDRLFAHVGGRLTRWPVPPGDDWRAAAYEAILGEVAP